MSNASAATAPISTLDDDAWDDLLSFIEERRVIPIVGPELLLVSTERGPRDRWEPLKLAAALYAQALAETNKSTGLLHEAAALIDSLPAALQALHDAKQWRERIRAAERGAR